MRRPILSLPVLLLLLAAAPASADERTLDGIAAQVGNDIVLISEVNQLAAPVEQRMVQAGAPPDEIVRMRADVLDRLIEARLLSDVVRRLELSASEAEIDSAIAGIARDTGLTTEQLEGSVASHGLTMDEYRAKIREEIERSKVLNSMVRSRVRVDTSEVRTLYDTEFGSQPTGGEEVHLRHLLVAFGAEFARDRDTACEWAQSAAEVIASGERPFDAVAREVSDVNRQRGGDLGWIHKAELAGWMADAVNNLEIGQITEVVETRYGCNVLELAGRREFEPVSFEQAQQALESKIMRRKMEAAYNEWVEGLRATTYVERKGSFRESASLDPASR